MPLISRPVHPAKDREIGAKRSLQDVQASLGRRIRALRVARNLTQEAMEARGLNYKYYQRIEAGRCNLTFRTLLKIGSALEVEVEDLFRFPLGASQHLPEAQEVIALLTAMIARQDKTALKKLQTFIVEILDRKPEKKRNRLSSIESV